MFVDVVPSLANPDGLVEVLVTLDTSEEFLVESFEPLRHLNHLVLALSLTNAQLKVKSLSG